MIAVSVLDALAAVSPVFFLDEVGIVSAGAQFALFGALALDIWRVKKWAWVTELALSAIQVTLLLAGLFASIILCADSVLSDDQQFKLVGYLVGLVILNAFVLWTLLRPSVRVQFTQVVT